MKLQRPRLTPVLPQWDLGIVLEALSKPLYESMICTTIVDPHSSLQNSKSILGKVKAYEVRAVATSLHNKVELQVVMKGREKVQWRHLHVLLPSRPLPTSSQYTKDQTGRSCRRDCGDLLGELIYSTRVYCVSSGSYGSPTPWFSLFKKGIVSWRTPPGLQIGKVFSFSVGSLIMVALEPVLGDTLPHLSYSGFI